MFFVFVTNACMIDHWSSSLNTIYISFKENGISTIQLTTDKTQLPINLQVLLEKEQIVDLPSDNVQTRTWWRFRNVQTKLERQTKRFAGCIFFLRSSTVYDTTRKQQINIPMRALYGHNLPYGSLLPNPNTLSHKIPQLSPLKSVEIRVSVAPWSTLLGSREYPSNIQMSGFLGIIPQNGQSVPDKLVGHEAHLQ